MEGAVRGIPPAIRRRPLAKADDPRHAHHHRNDPICAHDRGLHAGELFRERDDLIDLPFSTAGTCSIAPGVPAVPTCGVRRFCAGANLFVASSSTYRGQAKQVANAIWGSTAAHVRYKHITVVDDDIDVHDYAACRLAVAWRCERGPRENDVVIMPATLDWGSTLDPQARSRHDPVAPVSGIAC